jgi:hypothetical protein
MHFDLYTIYGKFSADTRIGGNQYLNFYRRCTMPESDSNSIGEHPVDSPNIAELVATMPDHIRQKFADYQLALNDEAAPGNEKYVSKLRHEVANLIGEELFRREDARREEAKLKQQSSEAPKPN